MRSFNNLTHTRLVVCIALLLGICACERDSYSTWSCHSFEESKIAMVLRKAQMEFQGKQFNYCGSLGNQSYFDEKCPAQIEQSSYVFTPSSGLLKSNEQEFQCTAL